MEAHRLRALISNFASAYSLQQSLRSLSSASVSPRKWGFFSDDPAEGDSSVYHHALKFQRPSTITWRQQLCNSASFIGTVDRPLKQFNTATGGLGAHTMLSVKISPNSKRYFRIFLKMWDEMAEISMKHLKPNDYIYVSGHLGSYTKAVENGKLKTNYQVIVKELNYVVRCGSAINNKSEQSDSSEGETGLGKYKNRLHLWQVFFANPSEWRDYRSSKVNANHPDFKHKDSGEALWINPNDPPWIKRQLQLYSSSLAENDCSREHANSSASSLSKCL
ncbi:protein OSB1, mitochondrial-like [Diospyros lotus]|uniref:protein OSB1, mitochondrial-like n=1 Tax=Diospyros lotus TaxID=55363 RepID=UPI0022512307|nr:protein OSB1, mitochondrial-like [Diospyros lotus]